MDFNVITLPVSFRPYVNPERARILGAARAESLSRFTARKVAREVHAAMVSDAVRRLTAAGVNIRVDVPDEGGTLVRHAADGSVVLPSWSDTRRMLERVLLTDEAPPPADDVAGDMTGGADGEAPPEVMGAADDGEGIDVAGDVERDTFDGMTDGAGWADFLAGEDDGE